MPLFVARAGDDSDEEETFMRPALAVHGDPVDEDSPPCDGLEYLRRVRKEATALPAIVTAKIEPVALRKRRPARSVGITPALRSTGSFRALRCPALPSNVAPLPLLQARLRAAETRMAERTAHPVLEAAASLEAPPPALLPKKQWQLRVLSEFAAVRQLLHDRSRQQVRLRAGVRACGHGVRACTACWGTRGRFEPVCLRMHLA